MATFYNSGQTNSTLSFVLSGITSQSYVRYVVCHWKKSSSSSYSTFQVSQIAIGSSANVNVTLGASTSLDAGTSYDAYLTLHLDSYTGTLNYTSGSDTGTTTISTPTGLHGISQTENSISVGWNSVAYAVGYNVRWRISGGSYHTKYVTGTSTTITGLADNTTYQIDVATVGNNTTSWESSYISWTTDQAIAIWDWYYLKTNTGVGTIAPNEWWDFMQLINIVRGKYGLGAYGFNWDTSYYDQGDFFYAWMMNQCATAIKEINGNMGGITIPTLVSGNYVYVSYFANLKSALNICINAL